MRTKTPFFSIGFIIYVVYISGPVSAVKNCAEAGGFCCKDNKGCNADGPKISDASWTGRCYCDNVCISLNDCCIDYNQTCLGNFHA